MPRKYHRPPDTTTKRRKARKSTIPYEFPATAEPAVDVDEAPFEEGDEDGDSSVSLASDLMAAVPARAGISAKAERHVTVDYSYVRGEVIRSTAIIGFLVISLIITSIFR
ncbi:MAG TPA: hypothetical protein VMT90_05315 [Dehalococcoidia bacterium]|nr:hypothetical protein [Dehalococcoidia bacterium]